MLRATRPSAVRAVQVGSSRSGHQTDSIRLNPTVANTDGDGLADGQELVVKSMKTPKRYPIGDGSHAATDEVLLNLNAPSWAIAQATIMVGVTHPDMGQVELDLGEKKDMTVKRTFVLKASGTHAGEANNFTSYDAFALGLAREDLSYGTEGLFLAGFDVVNGRAGQMEYLQVQVTLHTAPNRADSDGDGLNDSEEVNLGRDGSAMKP